MADYNRRTQRGKPIYIEFAAAGEPSPFSSEIILKETLERGRVVRLSIPRLPQCADGLESLMGLAVGWNGP